MERVSMVKEDDNGNFSFKFSGPWNDVVMLRSSIMSSVETFAIEYVTFYKNTSDLYDELIAQRLGALVINNEEIPQESLAKPFRIDVKGPGIINADDLTDQLPFAHNARFIELREDQEILCDVILSSGTGRDHVKWRPVSRITVSEAPDGGIITMRPIGMMKPLTIVKLGIDKLQATYDRPQTNIFFNHPTRQ